MSSVSRCMYCMRVNIGHWEKCCRNKNSSKVNRHVNRAIAALEDVVTAPRFTSKGNTPKKTGQGGKTKMSTHSRRTDYETDGEFYQQEFYAVNLGPKSLGLITQYTKSCDEAYTKLKIRPPGIRAKDCTLWLKIHTGASGNTLINGENISADLLDTLF